MAPGEGVCAVPSVRGTRRVGPAGWDTLCVRVAIMCWHIG